EVYGAMVVIDAIPLVLDRFPDVRFEMVGEGPQLASCKERAQELGIEKSVTWLPRRGHERVPQLLANWDLSVLPSHFESFGVAAIESAAMGVPVIASNVGGLPDSVRDGETGLLVQENAPGELAEAIMALLADPERRRRMGEAGIAWANQHFNWSAAMDQWELTLQQAADNARILV
ncbi:MAG: glycosyltransferase family 4 protein, partial [Planctomycetes bacterium]|nr:glycosyltransferase family 4 protein [Planctomycetota bacterium]